GRLPGGAPGARARRAGAGRRGRQRRHLCRPVPPRAAARAAGAAGHRRPAAAGGAAGGAAGAGRDVSPTRPGRTPYWPDRSALRRRRNARRTFRVLAVLVLVLPWFGYQHVRDWLRPAADANQAMTEAGPPEPPPPGRASRPAQAGATDAPAGLDAIDRDAR